jgi:hypothetical protein
MPFSTSSTNRLRLSASLILLGIFLLASLLVFAQVNLKYRMLTGYTLSSEAPLNKSKPTLFVFEQPETFGQVFQPAAPSSGRSDRSRTGGPAESAPNFAREMIIGVAIPPTKTPPRISISKVFVQDSTLTVRYISLADTTASKTPQPFTSQPTLVVVIPKQTVLRTRLIENGKVVQTLKKRESAE